MAYINPTLTKTSSTPYLSSSSRFGSPRFATDITFRNTLTDQVTSYSLLADGAFSNGYWFHGRLEPFSLGNWASNPLKAQDNDRSYIYNQLNVGDGLTPQTPTLFVGSPGLYDSGIVVLSATAYSSTDRIIPDPVQFESLQIWQNEGPKLNITIGEANKYFSYGSIGGSGGPATGLFTNYLLSAGQVVSNLTWQGSNLPSLTPIKANNNSGKHYVYDVTGVATLANGLYLQKPFKFGNTTINVGPQSLGAGLYNNGEKVNLLVNTFTTPAQLALINDGEPNQGWYTAQGSSVFGGNNILSADGAFSNGYYVKGRHYPLVVENTASPSFIPYKAKDNSLWYTYSVVDYGTPNVRSEGLAANGPYTTGLFTFGEPLTSGSLSNITLPVSAKNQNGGWYVYTLGRPTSATGVYSSGWFVRGTRTATTTGVPMRAIDNNKYYTFDNGNASLFTGYAVQGYCDQGVLSTRTAVATAVRPVLNNVHLDYRTLPPKTAVGLFAEGSLVEGTGRYSSGIKQATLTAPVTSLTNDSRHYFVVNEEVKLAAGNSFGTSKTLNVNEADYSSSASALSAMQVLSPLLSSNKDIAFLSNGVYSGGLKVTLPPGLAIAAYNDATKALTTYRLGLANVTAVPRTPATASALVTAPSAAVFAAETTANGGDYSVKLVSGPIYHYANASRFGKPQEVLGY